MKAMIFAAGLGTRLRPLTDRMPKALVPVGGVPLLRILMEKLKRQGFDYVVINVHHHAGQIVDYVRANQGFGLRVDISDESDGLLDTGGGLLRASGLLTADGSDEPILVHNVDIMSNQRLDRLVENHPAGADAMLLVSPRQTQRYLLFDDGMRLCGWTNRATGEVRPDTESLRQRLGSLHPLAFSGIHTVSPSLFAYMAAYPQKFSITQFYWEQAGRATITGYAPEDLRIMDVGKIETLSQAEQFMAETDSVL